MRSISPFCALSAFSATLRWAQPVYARSRSRFKVDFQKQSIEDIRRHFLAAGAPVSGQTLAKLRKDTRQGVQAFCRILEKRWREQKQEQRRVKSLLHFEEVLWRSGIQRIAGVDEVGIGPLAGPVVAAAVIFPPHTFIEGVDDSKKLRPRQRQRLRGQILECALAYSVAVVDVDEVDRLNVYHAGLQAMRRAVYSLSPQPQHVLVDAREIPELQIPQNRFNKGDGINFSIAAASIIAKTHRDALMDQLHVQFPQYGFNHHKGYSTKLHQRAIQQYGPCPMHRRSFPFVRELCGTFAETFYRLKAELEAAGSADALSRVEDRILSLGEQLTEYEARKLRLCCRRLWARVSLAGTSRRPTLRGRSER